MKKLLVVTAATALLALSFIDEALAQRGGGVRGEGGFQNLAQAAKPQTSKPKTSKSKAGRANSRSTGTSGFEHQQCTWKDPCRVYNF